MPAVNIFKLFQGQQNNLGEFLEQRGFDYQEVVETNESGVSAVLRLFYTQTAQDRPVKWVDQLRTVFSIAEARRDNFAAVVIIEFEDVVYAASYGVAHHFVSRFSDTDFGVDIAARAINEFRMKNSRDFGSARTKVIEAYSSSPDIAFEAGEAVAFLKGTTLDPNNWGKSISCGQSVQLRSRSIEVKTIAKTCKMLERALLLPVIHLIPRLLAVKDEDEISSLNASLIEDMQSGRYLVSISQQQVSGVDFIFPEGNEYFLKSGRSRLSIEGLVDLEELHEFVFRNLGGDYIKLLRSRVIAEQDDNQVFSRPFIEFVDYVNTEKCCYLEKGDWYRYDDHYVHNIHLTVDQIEIVQDNEIPEFDESQYQNWLAGNPDESLRYRECFLNNYLESNFGYNNMDRDLANIDGAVVETADLVKDETVFVVKIGKPQKLGYAIDQANASITALKSANGVLRIGDADHHIKKICLWLFFERETNVSSISQVKSLIFLMKLASWRKIAFMNGFVPAVKISYRR